MYGAGTRKHKMAFSISFRSQRVQMDCVPFQPFVKCQQEKLSVACTFSYLDFVVSVGTVKRQIWSYILILILHTCISSHTHMFALGQQINPRGVWWSCGLFSMAVQSDVWLRPTPLSPASECFYVRVCGSVHIHLLRQWQVQITQVIVLTVAVESQQHMQHRAQRDLCT